MFRGGDYPTLRNLQVAVNHLAELNRSCYQLNISGGECTYHPHFFDFIEYASNVLQDKLVTIHVTSNGSQNVEFYSRLVEWMNQKNLTLDLMISIHTEFASLKHIEELVKKISKKTNLYFALMLNPAKRDFVQQIFEMMLELRRDYPFKLSPNLLLEPPVMEKLYHGYVKEDILWQRLAKELFNDVENQSPFKSTYDVLRIGKPVTFYEQDGHCYSSSVPLKLGERNFKGMWCLCGTHAINILPDGTCEGLACSVFSGIPNRFKYNIFHENPYKMPDFIISLQCPYQDCPCPLNWFTPKFADKEESVAFLNIFCRKQMRLLKGCPD
jgi:hypothetical protein